MIHPTRFAFRHRRDQLEAIDQEIAEVRRIAKLDAEVAEMRRVRVASELAVESEEERSRERS